LTGRNPHTASSKMTTTGPPAFRPECCLLASTVVHEAVRGMRRRLTKNLTKIEKDCFGCPL
jgi:hypothetical protein